MLREFAPFFRPAPPSADLVHVEVGGRMVAVRLKRDGRARRLTLRVPVAAEPPVLTVPSRVARAAVEAFLDAHRDWLAGHLELRPEPTPFRDGSLIPLRDVPHRIVHRSAMRGAVVRPEIEAGEAILAVSGEAAHLPRRLRDWLVGEARGDLKAAVGRHAQALGARPKGLKVRDTVSRWGSCSADGVLSFSWRLVFAPPTILDYLAAHEVAHLVLMDHSPAYWRVVTELYPEHRAARAWLKREGARLHAIGADAPAE